MASSASSVAYAERYPEEVAATNTRHRLQKDGAAKISTKLGEFPAALSEPDWDLVHQLYEDSVEEGRSEAFVQHQREEIVLARFHEQERKPLVRRIAASNEYVAKEKGCDVSLWGASDRGLEKALEERLQARRRATSDVHRLIDDNEESLGKKNQDVLRDQVDEIRFTSYVVYVGLATEEQQLRQLVDEASAARSTLEERIEEEKAQEKPDAELITRLETALSSIEPEVTQAKRQLEQAEQSGKELRERFEAAMEQLLEAVEAAKDEQDRNPAQ